MWEYKKKKAISCHYRIISALFFVQMLKAKSVAQVALKDLSTFPEGLSWVNFQSIVYQPAEHRPIQLRLVFVK